LGTFFRTLYLPGIYLGSHLTSPVPANMKPLPRPDNEMLIPLPSGLKMPATGIGMCCRATAYHDESVRWTVLWWLLQGGRLIDTADLYQNHKAVGDGIRLAIARGIPRSEIFLTTKIPPEFYGHNKTQVWVQRMFKELALDYVDLVLLHAPISILAMAISALDHDFKHEPCGSAKACREETWRVLAAARKQGQIKELGVSNFGKVHYELLEASGALKEAPVAVNQLNYNPWIPQWEKDLVEFFQGKKVALTGYFSLGGGHSTGSTLNWSALNDMAKKYNKTAAQLLFRWSLQHGVAVIPGTGSPGHMRENLALFDFKLTKEEMTKIDVFGANETLAFLPDLLNPDKK